MDFNTLAIILALTLGPFILPSLIALTPISPIKWIRYIRDFLVFILIAWAIYNLNKPEPQMSGFFSTACARCGRAPNIRFILFLLIYESVFMGVLALMCKLAKFKCFSNWLALLISILGSTFILYGCSYARHDLNIPGLIIAYIIIEMAMVLNIIYKKATTSSPKIKKI